jgi:hypothetical protein
LQQRGELPLAREQRKLAAILTADVVGYSRLMGRDESGTLARLGRHLIADCSLVLRSGSGCIAGSPVTRVPNPSGSRQRPTSALYLQAMNNTEAIE